MSRSQKREIRIKEGSCRRLGKDITAYQREKEEQESKLVTLRGDEADAGLIRRQYEFINETEATLRDTMMQLRGSFEELKETVEKYQENAEVTVTEEFKKAVNTYQSTAAMLGITVEMKIAAPEASTETVESPVATEDTKETQVVPSRRVAVFGGSAVQPGTPAWDLAVSVGNCLATSNCIVVNGGYSGVMEAVSQGAAQVSQAIIEGVLVPSVFGSRDPTGNQYLTVHTVAATMNERLSTLTSADAFVVLPGSIGTLTELSLVWNARVVGANSSPKPIFVSSNPWKTVLTGLTDSLDCARQLDHLVFFDSVADLATQIAALSQ